MTLRSMIQELRVNADVANDEHRVKVRTGQFADLSARVSSALAELPGLNVGLAEIQQLDGETSPGRDQDAAQIADSLRALAAELSTLTIEQSLEFAGDRVRSAERYVSGLRTLVAGAWRAHVTQPQPAINSDLMDALARSGVDVEEIRDALETALGRLVTIRSTVIPGQGAVERFESALAEIHRCGEKLGEVVDADIAVGIVGSQEPPGVPLAWFTPDRLKKLAELGIVDRFLVRLR